MSQFIPAFGGQTSANFPPGIVIPFAGATAPTGWLLAFGQEVSRTDYAALFAAIGVTYGAGDAVTTFNLPDLRGNVVAGKDDMGGTPAGRLSNSAPGGVDGTGLGNSGGEQAHTLLTNELAAHTHVVPISTDNSPVSATAGPDVNALDYNGTPPEIDSSSVGGDSPHNNIQPTVILIYIIKT